MVPYSRILLSPLKPRIIQPPFNTKIEKIRGFNRLAPLNPPQPPKIKPPFANYLNPPGVKGVAPPTVRTKPSNYDTEISQKVHPFEQQTYS